MGLPFRSNFTGEDGLLQNRRDKFPYPKGRPIKERLGEEQRGHPGYYEESRLKVIVDECLRDPELLEEINNSIMKTDLFHRFLKYSFQTHLYQIQFNEKAFQNSNRPVIQKYGFQEKVKLGGSWVLVRDLTDERLDRLSGAYTQKTVQELSGAGKSVLYILLVISFVLYGNESIT
ncbi:MAG TPA: hypothetical protein VE544_03955 [Nitrososphaeraceae archaeon]|nr:hypothetical protein [Nitrososphaeraceae archaeon]